MNGINLIPAYVRRGRARAVRMRLWAGTLGVFGAALAVAYAWLSGKAPAPRDWALEMARATETHRAIVQDTVRVREALSRERSARQAAAAVDGQPDWSMLFAVLARTAGDEIWIESAVLRPSAVAPGAVAPAAGSSTPAPSGDDRTLTLVGMARTHAGASSFVLSLEETGLFSRVSLLETRRRALARGEAVGFRVECAMNSGGTP